MNPPSQSGDGEALIRAKKAHKDGKPYVGLSGHPWQCWLVEMEDGTRRRTGTPASGGGSGPRAARQNAEDGPCRSEDQPSWRESVQRAVAEGRRNAHPDAGKTAPRPCCAASITANNQPDRQASTSENAMISSARIGELRDFPSTDQAIRGKGGAP